MLAFVIVFWLTVTAVAVPLIARGWRPLLALVVLFFALLAALATPPADALARLIAASMQGNGADPNGGGEALAVAGLVLLIPIAALLVGIVLKAIWLGAWRRPR